MTIPLVRIYFDHFGPQFCRARLCPLLMIFSRRLPTFNKLQNTSAKFNIKCRIDFLSVEQRAMNSNEDVRLGGGDE